MRIFPFHIGPFHISAAKSVPWTPISSVHLHQNVQGRRKNTQQHDAIIHGHEDEETYAIVYEAKTKVHENGLALVLGKVEHFILLRFFFQCHEHNNQ